MTVFDTFAPPQHPRVIFDGSGTVILSGERTALVVEGSRRAEAPSVYCSHSRLDPSTALVSLASLRMTGKVTAPTQK